MKVNKFIQRAVLAAMILPCPGCSSARETLGAAVWNTTCLLIDSAISSGDDRPADTPAQRRRNAEEDHLRMVSESVARMEQEKLANASR